MTILTLPELARYLRVSQDHFYQNLRDEWFDLPKLRPFGHWRFDLEKVLKYFEEKYNEIKP